MITIHTKNYDHEYYGNIEIYYDDIMIYVNWWNSDLPPSDDELFTWCSNGFDSFWNEDIISITGHD